MAAAWFYSDEGENKVGPFTASELRRLFESGELRSSMMVWEEGTTKGIPAGEVEGLLRSAAFQSAGGKQVGDGLAKVP